MVAFEGRQLSVALLLVALAASAHGYCQNLQCPAPNGYFAHPQTCLSYIKCVDGEIFEIECPANLHFNPTTGMCGQPENSQCVEAEKEASGSCEVVQTIQLLRSAPISGIVCDCGKCCRKAVDTDCSAFYECDGDGSAIFKRCDTGLVFNPRRDDCDLPENYQCPFVQECKCKCRYPVDGECNAFHRCDSNNKYAAKEYCPEGLHFSEERQICTFPSLANCDVPATTPTTPEVCSTLSDTKADCKHWAANGDCKCDPFRSGDCSWQKYVKKHCPASCGCGDIEIVTKIPTTDECDGLLKCPEPYGEFPHPKSCTKWVHCSHNIPHIKDCPANLHFNPKLRVCDWPSSATCSAKSNGDCTISTVPTVKPTQGTTKKSTDGTTKQPTTSPKSCSLGNLECCAIDCSRGTYWPHPHDCTKFIQCAPYGPQEMPCGPGTRWDQDKLTCDHEWRTPCKTGNYLNNEKCGGTPKSTEPAATTPDSNGVCKDRMADCKHYAANGDCVCNSFRSGDCYWQNIVLRECPESCTGCGTFEPSTPPTPTKGTVDKCEGLLKCPKLNGEFPHPSFCNKWVHCSNNIPYVKDCPANLHFDPVLRVCNWPKDVVCFAKEGNNDCTVPDFTKPTSTPVIPPGICDCDCCLRSHPDDCTSYYYCDGGNTEFHTCSEGLVFHPVNETCVYASDYPECKIEPEPDCKCDCFEASEICSEYWICSRTGDKPEKKVCNGDLHFNPATHTCDHAYNVDCVSPSKRETGLLSRRQQPISASDCGKLPNGRYSAGSSSEFYNCFNSVAFLLKCQEGTAFNPATSKCQ